jgi:hypothetical protein
MLAKGESVRINPEIVLREEDEGAFLFDPDTGRICYLNEVGITIWKLCRKPIETDRIIKEISSEYPEITPEQISNDCISFLDDLKNFGFLATGAEA